MTADAAHKCSHCGQPLHPAVCPTIKAIEYFDSGSIKRVEYKTPADYAMPHTSLPPAYWPPQYPNYCRPYPLTTTWGGGAQSSAGNYNTSLNQ